ncbi:MAG: hypothetical protein ABSB73_09750 [Solirubrobacteraceae bacterium]
MERRSVDERRSGVDRRAESPTVASVSLEAYFELRAADLARRVAVLERHDETLREHQGDYLTRARYDEISQMLAGRLLALEKAAGEQEAVRERRELSRQHLVLLIGTVGAFTSAVVTLILSALGVR